MGFCARVGICESLVGSGGSSVFRFRLMGRRGLVKVSGGLVEFYEEACSFRVSWGCGVS